MSRTPLHVLDREQSDWSTANSSSSVVFFYDKTVVLYTPAPIGIYKYRLYKSFDLLFSHNIVTHPVFDIKVHRIEVKKLEPVSSYMQHKYIKPEQDYFRDKYLYGWTQLDSWPDPREMLRKIIADPKLPIYASAFKPLKGMWSSSWYGFCMDDCNFNFMYDQDTKRIIPIDMFIN